MKHLISRSPAHLLGAFLLTPFLSLAVTIPADLTVAFQNARYAIQAHAGTYHADNAANQFSLKFAGAETIIDAGQGAQTELHLAGYGWGSQLRPVGAVTQVESAGKRLERHYGQQLQEWFENTPQGLEQGFVLAQRAAQAEGKLRIQLAASGGWRVIPASGGVQLVRGNVTIAYSGLKAWDSQGKTFASHMRATPDSSAIEMEVDDAAAVYPLTVDPTFTLQAQLLPSNPSNYADVGQVVALSGDGNTALLWARGLGSTPDSVLVFVHSASGWTQQQILTADGSITGVVFGNSLALSSNGSTALIGAYGAGYVFTRTNTTWTQQQVLQTSTTQISTIALSGDGNTALVGANGYLASTAAVGAVYAFTRSGTTWTQQQVLKASDNKINDFFGSAMALSSDGVTALVEANSQGALYAFTRTGNTWTQQQKMTSPISGGGFGSPLALSSNGSTALVGGTDPNLNYQGVAYVYTRATSSWALQQELKASDGGYTTPFALSADGNTALGGVYLFSRTGATWTQQQKLSDGAQGDYFGASVALSSDASTVLSGAPQALLNNQGAAYVFNVSSIPATVNVTVSTTLQQSFLVDGVTYSAPQTFSWVIGTQHTLTANLAQPLPYTRYVLANWSDGGASSHIVTASASTTAYVATFKPQYVLSLTAGTGGSVSPAIANWYDTGTVVPITATPAATCNCVFSSWTGSGTVTSPSAASTTVTMNGPAQLTANFQPVVGTSPNSATYLGSDATTKGNWTGKYGVDGQLIANDISNPPSYGTAFANSFVPTYTWTTTTTDPRALQMASGSASRIASTYYTPNEPISFDVNLTDGNTHKVSLYLCDWDSGGRVETVTILNPVTSLVLSAQDFSSFVGGIYQSWNIKGHVTIRVTSTAGINGIVNALFFDPSLASATNSASYLGADTSTLGNWTGKYGAQGQIIPGTPENVPSYAAFTNNNAGTYVWTTSTTDPRALQSSSGSSTRISSTFYSYSPFTLDLNLKDGLAHKISFYLCDWDNLKRAETVTILDATTLAVLSTQSFSAFSGGVYEAWNIKGHVQIKVTYSGGQNGLINAIFFDAAPGTTTPATASFIGTDTKTAGTWTGKFGADGQVIPAGLNNPPSYAALKQTGASIWSWSSSTTDTRALQSASGSTSRLATTYYSYNPFTFDLNLTDNNSHKVSLYLCDWDHLNRAETITILDANTQAVLSTQSVSAFGSGLWLSWTISGHVQIKVTYTSGENGLVNGLFFN